MFLSIQLTMRIIYTLGKQTLAAAVRPHNTQIYFPASHSYPSLPCAHSGLGPCPQRAGVRGAEDLRLVRLLLAVSPHHRSRLAFLPAVGGRGSGSTGRAAGVSRPLKTSSQEERMTSELTSITTLSDGELPPSIRGLRQYYAAGFFHSRVTDRIGLAFLGKTDTPWL